MSSNLLTPVAVEIHDEWLWITLADGRVIGKPLSYFPWLAVAKPDQQTKVDFYYQTVLWDELDQAIDTEEFLRLDVVQRLPNGELIPIRTQLLLELAPPEKQAIEQYAHTLGQDYNDVILDILAEKIGFIRQV